MAVRERVVLDQLGEALRSELCIANPIHREIIAFADEFLLQHRKLPAMGDWELWLDSLKAGMQRDSARETLGRLLAIDLDSYTPEYFAAEALAQLQHAATQVAKARINEIGDIPLETFIKLAEQLEHIRVGSIQGLARLNDVELWAHLGAREDELISTGLCHLDESIGGWGKELWIVFADSGIGKSMFLQNCGAHIMRQGKRVLHITLELGLRSQIHRYYRQLAQAARAEFRTNLQQVKTHLHHWFKFAQGELLLLEYPAYSISPDELKRTIERVARTIGDIDVLILDYLDLLTLPRHVSARRAYEDLGRITHEVRGLCPTFDLTVLTASQAVRRPEKKGKLTIRDMGDSYNKVRGADGLLSLCQLPDEKEMHQGRVGILKSRDSGGSGEFCVYINPELAIIADPKNNPNIEALMTKLGHTTKPPQGTNP